MTPRTDNLEERHKGELQTVIDSPASFDRLRQTITRQYNEALDLAAQLEEVLPHYEYKAETVPGNFHNVAAALNVGGWLHGWELLTADHTGHYTMVLLRKPGKS